MIVFEIMGKEGDVKKMWNPAIPDEVEDARASFNILRAKGYLAFRVNEKGDKGEQMTTFDGTSGKVIMVPPMQGG